LYLHVSADRGQLKKGKFTYAKDSEAARIACRSTDRLEDGSIEG
jgi:hypothetical protein